MDGATLAYDFEPVKKLGSALWPKSVIAPFASSSSQQQGALASSSGLRRPWWGFLLTRRNLALSALTLIVHAATIALHTYATGFTYRRGVLVYGTSNSEPPLRDVLHDLLPNTQRYRIIPEIGHLIPVLVLVWSMLSHIDQRSLDAFRLFLWCHAALMLTRAASFSLTLLPDASQQCHNSLFIGSCHDLMFSGHAMITTLAALILQHFFTLPALIRWLLWANNIVVYILIITSHNHYTVDVITAMVLAWGVFLGFSRHPRLLQWAASDPLHILLKGGEATALFGLTGDSARWIRRTAYCDCSGYVDDPGFAPFISPLPYSPTAGDGVPVGGSSSAFVGGNSAFGGTGLYQQSGSRESDDTYGHNCTAERKPAVLVSSSCGDACCTAAHVSSGTSDSRGLRIRRLPLRDEQMTGSHYRWNASSAPDRGSRMQHSSVGRHQLHSCCGAPTYSWHPSEGWIGEGDAAELRDERAASGSRRSSVQEEPPASFDQQQQASLPDRSTPATVMEDEPADCTPSISPPSTPRDLDTSAGLSPSLNASET